ncbi:nucleotidyltransferase family protein [Parashewanella spongiae]|nr:nucleotidyltransferase family protein [Parashewanella spongiae]MCL1077558.1 nucleotidyltransferase family protein [Parashewanella spongiae]
MHALKTASQVAAMFQLEEHLLAAGFVRNLVWDKLHCLTDNTLTDVDFIYFEPNDISIQTEKNIEQALTILSPQVPWSVRNQARMHIRNGDAPYTSIADAMSYWPEQETANGIKLLDGELKFVSVFGLDLVFNLTISHNLKREIKTFQQRIEQKNWQKIYPLLSIICNK